METFINSFNQKNRARLSPSICLLFKVIMQRYEWRKPRLIEPKMMEIFSLLFFWCNAHIHTEWMMMMMMICDAPLVVSECSIQQVLSKMKYFWLVRLSRFRCYHHEEFLFLFNIFSYSIQVLQVYNDEMIVGDDLLKESRRKKNCSWMEQLAHQYDMGAYISIIFLNV